MVAALSKKGKTNHSATRSVSQQMQVATVDRQELELATATFCTRKQSRGNPNAVKCCTAMLPQYNERAMFAKSIV